MDREGNKYSAEDYITLPSGHRVLKKDFERSFNTGRDIPKSEKVIIDKLPSMSGSIAGASSKFLLAVQRHKEKEQARVAELERQEAARAETLDFEKQRLERKRLFDEEAAKKREKRQKRKSKQSSHGLGLPAEIVQQIRMEERLVSQSDLPAKSHSAHPLSHSAIIQPSQNNPSSSIEPAAKMKTNSHVPIRIIEEDD